MKKPKKTNAKAKAEYGRIFGLEFEGRIGESELFDGSLAERELGLVYTPFREGMQKAWNAFAPVFEQMGK